MRQDDEEGLVPAVVVKGKRSKRQRVHAPPVVLTAAAEWSSSAAASATAPGEGDSASGTSADDAASTGGCVTEEEEDMALCLMLLSRGEPAAKGDSNKDGGELVVKDARFRSRRPVAGAGEFVYECKTCNRCFPSFQALGGHRTSHKKPRLLPPSDDKSNPATAEAPSTAPPLPPPSSALKEASSDATLLAVVPKQEPGTVSATSSRHPSRVHECSVCGAEFASGQALGGHMRRHRPLAREDHHHAAPRKEKSLLELDLNMPCDEAVTSPRFGFAQPAAAAMLFPAALVDCHY